MLAINNGIRLMTQRENGLVDTICFSGFAVGIVGLNLLLWFVLRLRSCSNPISHLCS